MNTFRNLGKSDQNEIRAQSSLKLTHSGLLKNKKQENVEIVSEKHPKRTNEKSVATSIEDLNEKQQHKIDFQVKKTLYTVVQEFVIFLGALGCL